MNVKIYTTTTCHFCQLAKEFFKKNNIKYSEISVENNRQAQEEMIEKSGQLGVPVIDIGGKIVIGFDRGAIQKALSL